MKKLQKLLLALCFTIGLFGNSFAQVPSPDNTQSGVIAGGAYTYTVPDVLDHTWTWEVLDHNGVAAAGADYTLEDVSPAVGYSKKITWNTNGTFYVKVVTTITATGCTNEYAIQVDVASNDYTVAFNTGTVNVYCADDANIVSGMEMTLDVTLAGIAPAATYYDMEVQYQVDGGAIQTATIGTNNKFNIPPMDVVDPVNPVFTAVTVTIVQITDKYGVVFNPTPGNENFEITINPIPAKPIITF